MILILKKNSNMKMMLVVMLQKGLLRVHLQQVKQNLEEKSKNERTAKPILWEKNRYHYVTELILQHNYR